MEELHIGNLKVKIPIIQGGMGVRISLSGLAAEVANQGGIGVISAVGIGMKEKDFNTNYEEANKRALTKEIRKAKEKTKGIIGVNIMQALTDFENLLRVSLKEKVDVIFLGAGLPLKIPSLIKEFVQKNGVSINTKLVPKVSSSKAISLISKFWDKKYKSVPDAFVIEGPLAGGHLGFKRNDLNHVHNNLEKEILESVENIKVFEDKYNRNIPIIAAGGIYTGKDIYQMFKLGAQAVKIGTRFVTTHECDASIEFKKNYINCKKEDISIISSPVGLPGRVIRNKFVDEIEEGIVKPFKCNWRCLKNCNFKKVQYCIADALFNAADGKFSQGFSFAGAKAYMTDKIVSVKELMDELKEEYDLAKKILLR